MIKCQERKSTLLTRIAAKPVALVLLLSCLVPSFGLAESSTKRAAEEASRIEDFIPRVDGLENALQAQTNSVETLPQALQQISERKGLEQRRAPGWVKTLQTKTLATYFEGLNETSPKADLDATRARLLNDSANLFKYYESDAPNSKMYVNFVEKQLRKFIDEMNPQSLKRVYRNHQMAAPMSEWTVESLVVREQIVYLGHFPNVIKNTMNLVSGRHLRGATVTAGLIAMTAAAIYTGQTIYHISPLAFGMATGSFVGNMFFTAFKSSTLAGPLNGVLDCIFGPTNEYIGTQSSRYLGGVRRSVNRFYDSLKKTPEKSGEDSKRNETPNYPDASKDNMTFAGMTKAEQDENWDKCLNMWNGVSSTFGQLLRGNHHAGRSLMMIAWHDEQMTKILVETMDTKLIAYASAVELRMQFYKDLITGNPQLTDDEKIAKTSELMDHYDLFQSLTTKKWLDLALSENDISKIDQQITEHFNFLSLRLMKRDLDLIIQVQKDRQETIRSLFTALTLNEVRGFMVAESNRNLHGQARLAQQGIRKGFQLQSYVEEYQSHIQVLMQSMGLKNALKLMEQPMTCESVFN